MSIQLNELNFQDIGTPTGSITNLFDQAASQVELFANDECILDLDYRAPISVDAFMLTGSGVNTWPRTVQLFYLNLAASDEGEWVLAGVQDDVSISIGSLTTPLTTQVTSRYWRFVMTDVAGGVVNLQEVALLQNGAIIPLVNRIANVIISDFSAGADPSTLFNSRDTPYSINSTFMFVVVQPGRTVNAIEIFGTEATKNGFPTLHLVFYGPTVDGPWTETLPSLNTSGIGAQVSPYVYGALTPITSPFMRISFFVPFNGASTTIDIGGIALYGPDETTQVTATPTVDTHRYVSSSFNVSTRLDGSGNVIKTIQAPLPMRRNKCNYHLLLDGPTTGNYQNTSEGHLELTHSMGGDFECIHRASEGDLITAKTDTNNINIRVVDEDNAQVDAAFTCVLGIF